MAIRGRMKGPFGIYLTVTLALHAIWTGKATNIDCGGKAFYCMNSTNFMICVDQGNGIAMTVDDMSVPCPPGTECQPDNIFECEFPRHTIPLTNVPVMDNVVENSTVLITQTTAVDESALTGTQDRNTTETYIFDRITTDHPVTTESVLTFFDSQVIAKEETVTNISDSGLKTEKGRLFTTPLMQDLRNSSYNSEGISVTTNYDKTLSTQEVTMNTLSDSTMNSKAVIIESVPTVSQLQDSAKHPTLDDFTSSQIVTESKLINFTRTPVHTIKSRLSSNKELLYTTPSIRELMNSNLDTGGLFIALLNYNGTSMTQEVTMNTLADSTTETKNAANGSIATVEKSRDTTEKNTINYITTNLPNITLSKSDYFDFTATVTEVAAENTIEPRIKTEKEMLFTTPSTQQTMKLNNNSEGLFIIKNDNETLVTQEIATNTLSNSTVRLKDVVNESTSTDTPVGGNNAKSTLDYVTTNLPIIFPRETTYFNSTVTPRDEIAANKTESGLYLEKNSSFTASSTKDTTHLNHNNEGSFVTKNQNETLTTQEIASNTLYNFTTGLNYITTNLPIITPSESTYFNSTVTPRDEIAANTTESGLYSEKNPSFPTPSPQETMHLSNNSAGSFITKNQNESLTTQEIAINTLSNFTTGLNYITTNLPIISPRESTYFNSTVTPSDEIAANKTESGLYSEKDPSFIAPSTQETTHLNHNNEGSLSTKNKNETLTTQEIATNTLYNFTTGLNYITTNLPIITPSETKYFNSMVTPRDEIAANSTESGLYSEKNPSFPTPSPQETMHLSNNSAGSFITKNRNETLTTQEIAINTLSNFTTGLNYITTNLPIISPRESTYFNSTVTPSDEIAANKTESGLYSEKDPSFIAPSTQETTHLNHNNEGSLSTKNQNETLTTQEIATNTLYNFTTGLNYITTNLPIITPSETKYFNSMVTPRDEIAANTTESGLYSEKNPSFPTPSLQETTHLSNKSAGSFITKNQNETLTTQEIATNTLYNFTTGLNYITTNLPIITPSETKYFNSMVTPRDEIAANTTESGLYSEKNPSFPTPSLQETTHLSNKSAGSFITKNQNETLTTQEIATNTSYNFTMGLNYITTNSPIISLSESTYFNSTVTPRDEIIANTTERGLNSEKDPLFTTYSVQETIYSNNSIKGPFTSKKYNQTLIAQDIVTNVLPDFTTGLNYSTTNLPIITLSKSTHFGSAVTPREEISRNTSARELNSEKDLLFTASGSIIESSTANSRTLHNVRPITENTINYTSVNGVTNKLLEDKNKAAETFSVVASKKESLTTSTSETNIWNTNLLDNTSTTQTNTLFLTQKGTEDSTNYIKSPIVIIQNVIGSKNRTDPVNPTEETSTNIYSLNVSTIDTKEKLESVKPTTQYLNLNRTSNRSTDGDSGPFNEYEKTVSMLTEKSDKLHNPTETTNHINMHIVNNDSKSYAYDPNTILNATFVNKNVPNVSDIQSQHNLINTIAWDTTTKNYYEKNMLKNSVYELGNQSTGNYVGSTETYTTNNLSRTLSEDLTDKISYEGTTQAANPITKSTSNSQVTLNLRVEPVNRRDETIIDTLQIVSQIDELKTTKNPFKTIYTIFTKQLNTKTEDISQYPKVETAGNSPLLNSPTTENYYNYIKNSTISETTNTDIKIVTELETGIEENVYGLQNNAGNGQYNKNIRSSKNEDGVIFTQTKTELETFHHLKDVTDFKNGSVSASLPKNVSLTMNSNPENHGLFDNIGTKVTSNPFISVEQNFNILASTPGVTIQDNSDSVNKDLKPFIGATIKPELTLSEDVVSEVPYDVNTFTTKRANNTIGEILETVDANTIRNIATQHKETPTESSVHLTIPIDVTSQISDNYYYPVNSTRFGDQSNDDFTNNIHENAYIINNESINNKNNFNVKNIRDVQVKIENVTENFETTVFPLLSDKVVKTSAAVYPLIEKTTEDFLPLQSTVPDETNVINDESHYTIINILSKPYDNAQQETTGDTSLVPSSKINISKKSLYEARAATQEIRSNIATKESKNTYVTTTVERSSHHVTENPLNSFNTPSMKKDEHLALLHSSTKHTVINVETQLGTKSQHSPAAVITENKSIVPKDTSKYNKRNISPDMSRPNPTIMNAQGNANETDFNPKPRNVSENNYPDSSLTQHQAHRFSCVHRKRGRYSDPVDCKKFYVCVGRHDPIIGRCPLNTVFSDNKKQCTKTLSECVSKRSFECTSEGRFIDDIEPNLYYICVRNKNDNRYVRFRFACQTGYYLRGDLIKCVHYETTSDIGTDSRTISTDESSRSDSSNKSDTSLNNSKETKSKRNEKRKRDNVKAVRENQNSSGDQEIVVFRCVKEGKFPDHTDCRRYYECKKRNGSLRRKRRKCDTKEVFHREKKKCVDADSHECT